MTHTQQIIQDAVSGGWRKEEGVKFMLVNGAPFLVDEVNPPYGVIKNRTVQLNETEKYVLDPTFWQAVGKTRGWGKYTEKEVAGKTVRIHSTYNASSWQEKSLYYFISVMEGDDYETALSKLV